MRGRSSGVFRAAGSLAVIAVFAGGVRVVAEEAKEVVVRAISKWDAGCDGGQRDSWDNMARAWYDEITDNWPWPWGHGSAAWAKDGFYHNGNIVDSDFTDADKVAWGNDLGNDRADDVDVMMVALHGGNANDNRWTGRVRVNEAGDGNCDTYQGSIVLGEAGSDLEFLHLSSCFSMDQEDWWPAWSDTFKGLHQIHGFHGIMWISSARADDYEDFADDAFDIPLVEAWYDNLYDTGIGDGDWDQCPVARGAGTSQNNLWSRMDHERYNNVYSDPTNPSWHGVVYIRGCDPKDKPALPN